MSIEDWNEFRGPARRITEGEIAAEAEAYGIEWASLKAVMEIEAANRGFDGSGRPKMLFEPYHFYRRVPTAHRQKALAAGVATTSQPSKYPAESYTRLIRAMELDETSALESASWGLGQVMGFNHQAAGYATVQDMVHDMMQSELQQLRAMLNFIRSKNLVQYMREHRWTSFALGYNGVNQARNKYDSRLAASYAKWAKKTPPKPTSDTPDVAENLPADVPRSESFMYTKPIVQAVQEQLRKKGYFVVGKIDGLYGKRTRAGIVAFQTEHDIEPADGKITPELIEALENAPAAKISATRAGTTVEDLRKGGSQTIKQTDATKRWSVMQMLAGIMATGFGIMADWFPQAWESLSTVRSVFTAIPAWVWGVAAILIAFMMYRKAQNIEWWRLDDERSGRHNGVETPAGEAETTEE